MSNAPRSEDLRAAALDYAARNWRVVLLHDIAAGKCSCGRDCGSSAGKHPRLKSWPENASTDADQIVKWWTAHKFANVGIALGTLSGLVAVDIDSSQGEEILATLANGDLPLTLEMTTSAGKRRLLYSIPDSLEFDPKTCNYANPEGGGEAIRFQSTGAQCVMPPSLHPSGVQYAWVSGRSPAEIAVAPMPAWMIAEMAPPPEPVPTPAAPAPAPVKSRAAGSGDQPEVVANFNRSADWMIDVLASAGWKHSRTRPDGVIEVTRPGKDGGTSATIGHHKAKDGTPALHVFTGSVAELPPGHCWDKFGCYARLWHGGDHAAAMRALAATGKYGVLRGKPPTTVSDASQTVAASVAGATGGQKPEPLPWANRSGRGQIGSGITASDLVAREFEPPKFAVDNLLSEGLTVFGGRPKQGKSWFSLLLGWAVAGGHSLDGREVKKGQVLYLALEDTQRRLQQRLTMLKTGLDWPIPDGLHLHCAWPRANDDGLYYMHDWLTQRKGEARLVIVDTLGRFRKPQKSNGNSYAEDYEALGDLKGLLDYHGVSGIVVHHTRKLKAEDPFEELSGTMAISGAADGLWVLDRTRGATTAQLYATGRDLPDLTVPLTFQTDSCVWKMGESREGIEVGGRTADPGMTKVQQCMIWLKEFLKEYAYPSIEVEEAGKKTGFSHSVLRDAKAKLGRNGTREIVNVNRGGDAEEYWWCGLGSPVGWRLRPVDIGTTKEPSVPY